MGNALKRQVKSDVLSMSLKVTTQNEWRSYSLYSKYHPDNLESNFDMSLPEKPTPPPPVVSLTPAQLDDCTQAWGHSQICELPYGPVNQNPMITRQIAITPKVGKDKQPPTSLYAESGRSQIKASFSGGPMRNRTASEWADDRQHYYRHASNMG